MIAFMAFSCFSYSLVIRPYPYFFCKAACSSHLIVTLCLPLSSISSFIIASKNVCFASFLSSFSSLVRYKCSSGNRQSVFRNVRLPRSCFSNGFAQSTRRASARRRPCNCRASAPRFAGTIAQQIHIPFFAPRFRLCETARAAC